MGTESITLIYSAAQDLCRSTPLLQKNIPELIENYEIICANRRTEHLRVAVKYYPPKKKPHLLIEFK